MNHPYVEIINNVSPFLQRKNTFFMDKAQNRRVQPFLNETLIQKDVLFDAIENQASQVDYTFLNEYKSLFEKECNVALNALNLNKEEDVDYLLWCYFCACLQEQYHKDYRQKREAQAIQDGLKAKIKNYAYNNQATQNVNETIFSKIKDFAISIPLTLAHMSDVRNLMGFINASRLEWIYVRSVVIEVLSHARKKGIWDNILNSGSIFKDFHIDLDDFIGAITHPYFRLALLMTSVLFFMVRLAVVHIPLIVLHTLNPTEREAQMKPLDRLWLEIKKRHPGLLNDTTWGPVNFVTNFKSFCDTLKEIPETSDFIKFILQNASFLDTLSNIPDEYSGLITGVFLFFDAGMILWCYDQEEANYLNEWKHFDAEIKHNEKLLQQEQDPIRRAQIELCLKNARNNRLALENNWRAQQKTYVFILGAAAILGTNFLIALFAAPVGVILCYAMCSIATAMYMSQNEFKTYQEKKYALEYAGEGRSAKEMELLNKDFEFARFYFITTFLEHLILPSLTIALYAVCWPMAIALTVAVLSYKFVLKPTLKHRHEEGMKLLENEVAVETHGQHNQLVMGGGGGEV